MSRRAIHPLVLLALAGASGCDNRQAFEDPDPTLARMLAQRRADPYETTKAFADEKTMQAPPKGTVPADDDRDAPSPPVTRALLRLGRARFDTVCATCHGVAGDGVSVVATKMELHPAPTLVDAENRGRSRELLYDFITEGYGLMPSYADMLRSEERWAVVAYLQALQLAQHARVSELPASVRDQLFREAR